MISTTTLVDSERRGGQAGSERYDDSATGRVVVGAGYVDPTKLALGQQPEAAGEAEPNRSQNPARQPEPARDRLEDGRGEDQEAVRGDPTRHQGDDPRMEDEPAPRGVHVGHQAERPLGLSAGLDRGDDVPAASSRQASEIGAVSSEPSEASPAAAAVARTTRANRRRTESSAGRDREAHDQRERGGEGRVTAELLDPRLHSRGSELGDQ